MAAVAKQFREDYDPLMNALFKTDINKWSEWVILMKPQHDGNDDWTTRSEGHRGYRLKSLEGIIPPICGIYEWRATKEGTRHYVVYIGSTCMKAAVQLLTRLNQYCLSGSHKHKRINKALRKGYTLSVRYLKTKDKSAAEDRENKYLSAYNYAWNYRNNQPTRYELLS